MSIAQKLANSLHRFNAKERNFLLRFALLGEADPGVPTQSTNWINSNFFRKLKDALETEPVAADRSGPLRLSPAAHCVYAGMDYHLDWLHAALCDIGTFGPIKLKEVDQEHQRCWGKDSLKRFVVGTQEDVDLLVLIQDGSRAFLVLIEAKGVASFSPEQLNSKLTRLNDILGEQHVPGDEELQFFFVLLAPGKQEELPAIDLSGGESTPDGAGASRQPSHATRLRRITRTMKMPNFPEYLDRVTRCDSKGRNEKGSNHESRKTQLTHWKAVPRSKAQAQNG